MEGCLDVHANRRADVKRDDSFLWNPERGFAWVSDVNVLPGCQVRGEDV